MDAGRTDEAGAGRAREGGGAAEQVARQVRRLEHVRELKAEQKETRDQLAKAQATRGGNPADEGGWFERRLEGKRQEKQARRHLEDVSEKLEGLSSERSLKKQVGKDVRALGEKERQQLGKALSPAQQELAKDAFETARGRAARPKRQVRQEHERGGISM